MARSNDVEFAEKQDATVIDFEAAAQRITADRLAAALLRLASNGSIRLIEALASTIVNGLRSERDIDRPFALERVDLLRFPASLTHDDSPKTAAFRRIARRALSGTLNDPTEGATAFHHIDTTPEWSTDLLPTTVFGPFLFYKT